MYTVKGHVGLRTSFIVVADRSISRLGQFIIVVGHCAHVSNVVYEGLPYSP